MRMTVFLATLDRPPRPAAELARLAWTTGVDRLASSLAPAVAHHVVPRLVECGLLPLDNDMGRSHRLRES